MFDVCWRCEPGLGDNTIGGFKAANVIFPESMQFSCEHPKVSHVLLFLLPGLIIFSSKRGDRIWVF